MHYICRRNWARKNIQLTGDDTSVVMEIVTGGIPQSDINEPNQVEALAKCEDSQKGSKCKRIKPIL